MVSSYYSAKEQLQIAQIETFLKDFGFNNREIAIYLALLKIKKAPPTEISKLANIERSDAYRILDTLVTKGYVVKVLEKPIQYAVAPPEKAFKRNLEEKRLSLSTLEGQVEESSKVLSEYLGKSDGQTDVTRFEIIKSRQFIFERIAEMLSAERCQKEVLFYGTEKTPGRLLFYLKDLIVQLPKRHIDFRIMLPITQQNIEDVKVLSKSCDIKHLQQTRGKVIIVDQKESMLTYTMSDNDTFSDELGLWLNNPQFAQMQAEMFEAQWKLALGLHSKIEELEAHSAEINDEEATSIVFTIDTTKGLLTFLSPNVDPTLAGALQGYVSGLFGGQGTESYQEDKEKALQLWSISMQGVSGKNEFRAIKKDGKERWWSVSWLPLSGKKGDTDILRVVLKDITSVKKLEIVEKELVKSKELLTRSQEIAHLGSWELDILTDTLSFSDEVYRIFGLKPEQKTETFKAFLGLVTQDSDSIHDNVQRFLQNNPSNVIEMEQRIVRKDGSEGFIHLKGEITRDSSGKAVKSIGFIHDISELKKAQQALIESEKRYRLQFEEATDAIILADIETGLIVDCNHAATQLTGFTHEELVGKSQKTLHPDQTQSFDYHVLTPDKPVNRKVITKSGALRDVVIKAAIFDVNGRGIIQGIFRDVTEQKKVEEAVMQSKQNYERFLDDIEDFLFTLNDQGNILEVNNAVLRLGYTREELIGQPVLNIHPPELRDEAARVVQEMLAGKTSLCTIPLMTKDGQLITVNTRITRWEWGGKSVLLGVSKEADRDSGDEAATEK